MPFTIGGDWISGEEEAPRPKGSGRPVKVRAQKRGKVVITSVLNLALTADELGDLCKEIKRSLGCGGTVKKGVIELQGDCADRVRVMLVKRGIKAQ